MPYIKSQKYCPSCRKFIRAERDIGMADSWGILLSLLTCGLFLPVFLLIRLANFFNPWKCPHCGTSCHNINNKK